MAATSIGTSIPPLPLHFTIQSLQPGDSKTEFIGGEAASRFFEIQNYGFNWSDVKFPRIISLLDEKKIALIGNDQIVFEQIPDEVFAGVTLPQVPPAQRGESWSYQPEASGERTLIKGPEGLTQDSDGALVWEVPSNFRESYVVVKLKSKETREEEWILEVTGDRLAVIESLTDSSVNKGLPLKGRLPFPEKIDEVLSMKDREHVLVVSGHRQNISVVHLETCQVVSQLRSPGGHAIYRLAPDGTLLIHYLAGNILEQRTLPDLKVRATSVITFPGKLQAFVGGAFGKNSVPYLISSTLDQKLICQEVNLNDLTLGPHIIIPIINGYNLQPNEWDWLTSAISSGDGRRLWFSVGNLFEQIVPGQYEVTQNYRLPRWFSFVTTNLSGNRVIGGLQGFDLDTGRQWEQENKRNISRLYANGNGRWLVGLSSDHVNKEANLILKKANTLELAYEIRDLEEFSGSTERYALSKDFRWAYVCGENPHLLTISDQRSELWVREIPAE